MMNQNDPTRILQRAMKSLGEAELETDRPVDDVVTCLVCSKLRDSAVDFLNYYLKINGMDPSSDASIADLKHQCASFNPAFGNVDIEDMDCFHVGGLEDNTSFCHDIKTVNSCITSVYELKNLVFEAAQARTRVIV